MTIEEVKKRCTGTDFGKHNKARDGRRSQCKECTNEAAPSRAANPVKVNKPRERIKGDCMQGWWV